MLGVDINAHSNYWHDKKHDTIGNFFASEFSNSILHIHNNRQFTRKTSIIDLTLTSFDIKQQILNWRVHNRIREISDHNIIHFDFEIVGVKAETYYVSSWDINDKSNWEEYKECLDGKLNEFAWTLKSNVIENQKARKIGISAIAENYIKCITNALNLAIGRKVRSRFSKPYWNHKLQKLKRKLKTLSNQLQRIKKKKEIQINNL